MRKLRIFQGLLALALVLASLTGSVGAPADGASRARIPVQAPQAIRQKGLPALVEFYATWCSACKQLEPQLQALEKQTLGRLSITRIDVDDPGAHALTEAFGIRTTPSYYFYDRDGALFFRMDDAVVQSGLLRAVALELSGQAPVLDPLSAQDVAALGIPPQRGLRLAAFHRKLCSPCDDAQDMLKQARKALGARGDVVELDTSLPAVRALMTRWGVASAPAYVLIDENGAALLTMRRALDSDDRDYITRFIRLWIAGRP